jgi:hypothetical protein
MDYQYFMAELEAEYSIPSSRKEVVAFYERKLSIKKVVTWDLLIAFCS